MTLHRFVAFGALTLFVSLPIQAQSNDRAKKQRKPVPAPSIVWVNPPEEKHLPLAEGATHETFRSKLAARDVGYVVYLPPQYSSQPDRRFPVIYNLHGNGGNELTSLNVLHLLHDQISRGKVPPLIMVLANGGHSTFYKNSHDGKLPIESIVMTELIPHVDAKFRTIAQGKGRCIEGFSMGGRGATRLAVKYPDSFCSLFCQAGNVPRLLQTYDQLTPEERERVMLGPDRENWAKDDVYALTKANRQEIKMNLRIQIACGTKDGGHLPSIRDWHSQLVELGMDHTYIELQGLAHKRTEMMDQLRPIWFDGHLTALRRSGALPPAKMESRNASSNRTQQAKPTAGKRNRQQDKSQGNSDQDAARSETSETKELPEGVQVERDLVYTDTEHGPQHLDLYRPADIDGPLPVILFVHGGGWKGGDKKSGWKNAGWLVEEGYAIATINYRLLDTSSWPTQINDVYAAVRWLRENTDRYQLDPDRVVVWGTSAGGHLAALAGARPFPGKEETNSRVNAVIDWFGPADLLTMPPNVVSETRSFEEVSKSNGARLLQAPVMTVPELAKDASALYQVSKDDPPMLLMHGDQDTGVPLDQSARLAEALREAGVPVQMHVVEGAGHGGKQFQLPESRAVVRAFLRKHLVSPAE